MQPSEASPETPKMQPDVAEALMREVGSQLRQVREERGEDLEEVADYLRIRAIYLQGIEEGDLSMMPGRTYALGFLRTYADYLGFDGDDLIEQIRSIVEDLTDRARLEMKAPLHESRVPKAPVLVLSAAALAGIYVGWTYLERGGSPPRELVAEVPADLRIEEIDPLPEAVIEPAPDEAEPTGAPADGKSSLPLAGGDVLVATSEPPEPNGTADASPAETVDADEGPAASQQTADATLAEADQAAEADADAPAETGRGLASPALAGVAPDAGPDIAADVTPAAGPPVPEDQENRDPGDPALDGVEPAARVEETPPDALAVVADLRQNAADGAQAVHERVNRDARVILHATSPSWVQISSPSGDYLRSRTLAAGDVFLVPNRTDLRLWTGNAGGLEVIVDGERLPPLGPEGRIVRDVSLDPAALRPGPTGRG